MVQVENNLEKLRIENSLTRPQLADMVGVGWETIKAYEKKGAVPSLPVALRISKVFNKSVEEIFNLKVTPEELAVATASLESPDIQ